jgi:hypothetical protein
MIPAARTAPEEVSDLEGKKIRVLPIPLVPSSARRFRTGF